MKTIYKYPLINTLGPQKVKIPACSEFRHFQEQDGVLTAWFEVNTDEMVLERTLLIIGTGHPIPENAHYLGTCQHGQFIWHLYWIHGV